MLRDLRMKLEIIDEAIEALQRLAAGSGKRRGRPPLWMAAAKAPKRPGRPPGSKSAPTKSVAWRGICLSFTRDRSLGRQAPGCTSLIRFLSLSINNFVHKQTKSISSIKRSDGTIH